MLRQVGWHADLKPQYNATIHISVRHSHLGFPRIGRPNWGLKDKNNHMSGNALKTLIPGNSCIASVQQRFGLGIGS